MSRVLYDYEDGKYRLTRAQIKFMDNFKNSHDFRASLEAFTAVEKNSITSALARGKSDFTRCYNDYINSAPQHPEVNKVVILNDLEMAFKENDTALLMKVIPEINKMIKGNLSNTAKEIVKETKFVGIIDLSREAKMIDEPKTIDITENGNT